MLLTFRSFTNNPYVYDPRSNEIFRVDEHVFDELSRAGGKINTIADEKVKQGFRDAGVSDEVLPLQSHDQFKKEILDMDIGMRKLIIGLAHTCNLRCKYCIYSGNYSDERTHEGKQMAAETADRLVDMFFVRRGDDYPKTAIFYGGEPFTNFPVMKRIVEKIMALRDDVAFSATTNGLMLKNEEILEFIVGHNFIINISFDGPSQEDQRIDQNGRGTFKDVMGLIEHIAEKFPEWYKENVGFNVTVTPASDLHKTVEFFNTKPLFRGKTLNIIRHYDPDNVFCRKYDLMDHEKTLRDEFERLRRDYPAVFREHRPFHDGCYLSPLARLDQRPMGDVTSLPLNSCCYPGLNAIFVDIDGTCSPCERTEHIKLGSIYDDDPVNLKIAEELVRKYQEIAGKHCPQCWAARLCAKCFSHVRRGTVTEENFVANCDDFRDSFRKSMELFTTIKEINEKAFADVKVITELPVKQKA
ncbi:MAG: radical SAM protein [Candidatus Xenobiia bacterium LiM19]